MADLGVPPEVIRDGWRQIAAAGEEWCLAANVLGRGTAWIGVAFSTDGENQSIRVLAPGDMPDGVAESILRMALEAAEQPDRETRLDRR